MGHALNLEGILLDVQHAIYSSASTLDWTRVVDRTVCIFGSRQTCLHPCIRCTACLLLRRSNSGFDGCCRQKCLHPWEPTEMPASLEARRDLIVGTAVMKSLFPGVHACFHAKEQFVYLQRCSARAAARSTETVLLRPHSSICGISEPDSRRK